MDYLYVAPCKFGILLLLLFNILRFVLNKLFRILVEQILCAVYILLWLSIIIKFDENGIKMITDIFCNKSV